jgi:hypothetical protein
MRRKITLSLPTLMVLVVASMVSLAPAPKSAAQVPPYGCDAEYSGTQCDALVGDDSGPYTGGGDQDCSNIDKTQNCSACKSYCDCVYNNSMKKCKANTACINVAASEKNACYGNCSVDFEDACL